MSDASHAFLDSLREFCIAIDATGLVGGGSGLLRSARSRSTSRGLRLLCRAMDGVTTALDFEAGVIGLDDFVEDRRGRSSIHFGAAAGHIGSREYVKHGTSTGHVLSNSVVSGSAPQAPISLSPSDD